MCRDPVLKISAKHLLPVYLHLSASVTDNIELWTSLFEELIDKTFHCEVGALLKLYKSENLGWGTKGENMSGTHEEVKHLLGTKAAAAADKKERENRVTIKKCRLVGFLILVHGDLMQDVCSGFRKSR